MGSLLSSILPLAVGAAISPTVLALQLLLLSSKKSPLKRSLMALAGSALVLLGYTALALALGAGSEAAAKPSTTDGVVKLIFGVLLLGLGIRAMIRDPKPAKPEQPGGSAHLLRSFELGAGIMLLNFTTLALYFPALHEVAVDGGVEAPQKAIAVVIVFLFAMLPAYMPLVATVIGGNPARRALERFNGFLTRHTQAITVGICFLFAAYLGVSGARILFS